MQFPSIILMVWCYKRQYPDKTLTLRKKYLNMGASGANDLKFFAFSHYKTAISFYILVLQILCLRNIYIFPGHKLHLHNYMQSMQLPCITNGMALYINDSLHNRTLYYCENYIMRASLDNFRIFII